MKTKLQIILETYEAYKDVKNRAFDPSACTCVYNLDDGAKKCAFGRCEIDPPKGAKLGSLYRRFGYNFWVLLPSLEKSNAELQDALKEEYRGHDVEFWHDIQDLHDVHCYFDEETWSPCGLEKIISLISHYAQD